MVVSLVGLVSLFLILQAHLRAGRSRQTEAAPPARQEPGQIQRRALQVYGKLPLRFEANQGQSDRRVKFISRGLGYALFLTSPDVVLGLDKSASTDRGASQGAVLQIQLAGANPEARVYGLDELPVESNYFIGNDPAKWRVGVASYARVKYEQIYPGIDLIFYGNQRQLEYDFVVTPGADPGRIQLRFQGASAIRIDRHGDLLLNADGGEVRLDRPLVYQAPVSEGGASSDSTASRQLVEARYVLSTDRQVGIELAAYNRERPLIIDPVLSYSTYLGGRSDDEAHGIAVDSSGNAYIAGLTRSDNFPTEGGFQTTFIGAWDAFVTKLNPNATAPLLYSTYLGGATLSFGRGIAVDDAGNAYVVGETTAPNFPTRNGFQTQLGGPRDAFVAKLNTNERGDASLVYSTLIGGSNSDYGFAIAIDSTGNAYVTGKTNSHDFPTKNALQQTYGGGVTDAFVTKIDTTRIGADSLAYSTYLGGGRLDEGRGIAADSDGQAYVTGLTNSIAPAPFPTTPGTFQTVFAGGQSDAFVTKIDTTRQGLESLIYSTLLGGTAQDDGNAIALDSDGNAYVTGFTASEQFPTTSGAFQSGPQGAGDAFVTQFNASGSALIYSTYLGGSPTVPGSGRDEGFGIAVDSTPQNGGAGLVYVTGTTRSVNFPIRNGFQGSHGGGSGNPLPGDAFISEFDTTQAGSASLVFSSYHGGRGDDIGRAIAVNPGGIAYFAGITYDSTPPGFPTRPSGVFQRTYGGGVSDAFVAKVLPGTAPLATLQPERLDFGNQPIGTSSNPRVVTLTNSGNALLTVTQIILTGTDATQFTLSRSGSTPCPLGEFGLPPGVNCTFTVAFNPTTTGPKTANVEVASDAAGSPDNLPLTGTGIVGPAVRLEPARLDFGDQGIGTSSDPRMVTLTNTGDAPLNLTSITLTGINPTQFILSQTISMPCSFGTSTLPAGTQCTFNVAFHPTTTGPKTANVQVVSNAASSPDNLPLTGTGIVLPGPAVSLEPSSLGFGNQTVGTTSEARAATLRNVGDASLAISSIAMTGANPDDFSQTNTCGGTLAPGQSCNFDVTFRPTASANRTAAVRIVDNAPGSPHQVTLSGTGVSAGGPLLTLSATRLIFAGQMVGTTSAALGVLLTSSGRGPVTINRIALTGADASEFAMSDNCPARLAEGASCRVDISFTPGAAVERTATVRIDDDVSDRPETIELRGTGNDFLLQARDSAPTSITVGPGETATYNLEVVPLNGFTGSIEIACAGAPAGTSCTASLATASISGPAPVPFNVSLVRASSTQVMLWPNDDRPRRLSPPTLAILLLSALLLLAAIVFKRRVQLGLAPILVGLALSAASVETACGKTTSAVSDAFTLTITGRHQNVTRPLMLTVILKR